MKGIVGSDARGSNKYARFGKGQRKLESSATGSIDSAAAPDWKITDASIPQDYLNGSLGTYL